MYGSEKVNNIIQLTVYWCFFLCFILILFFSRLYSNVLCFFCVLFYHYYSVDCIVVFCVFSVFYFNTIIQSTA